MNDWMNEWIYKSIDQSINLLMNRWMDGQMDEWINKRHVLLLFIRHWRQNQVKKYIKKYKKWMNEWTDEPTDRMGCDGTNERMNSESSKQAIGLFFRVAKLTKHLQ